MLKHRKGWAITTQSNLDSACVSNAWCYEWDLSYRNVNQVVLYWNPPAVLTLGMAPPVEPLVLDAIQGHSIYLPVGKDPLGGNNNGNGGDAMVCVFDGLFVGVNNSASPPISDVQGTVFQDPSNSQDACRDNWITLHGDRFYKEAGYNIYPYTTYRPPYYLRHDHNVDNLNLVINPGDFIAYAFAWGGQDGNSWVGHSAFFRLFWRRSGYVGNDSPFDGRSLRHDVTLTAP